MHVLWPQDLPFFILICSKWVFLRRIAVQNSNLVYKTEEDLWSLNGTSWRNTHASFTNGLWKATNSKMYNNNCDFISLRTLLYSDMGGFMERLIILPGLCILPFSLNNCSLSIKRSICWVVTPTLPDCSSFTWSALCAELSYSARFFFFFPRNAVDYSVGVGWTWRNSPL